jgi:hypothetical protein
MESRLVDTTPTTRNDALARCLIAIELSKASWVVGVQSPLSSKTSQYRLTAGDWKSSTPKSPLDSPHISPAMTKQELPRVLPCYGGK